VKDLSELEKYVLDKLLSGDHPILNKLRGQLDKCGLKDREFTGEGFSTSFVVDDQVRRTPGQSLVISDIDSEAGHPQLGTGFALIIEDGVLSALEAFNYDETRSNEE
jgi:hypothetical protein